MKYGFYISGKSNRLKKFLNQDKSSAFKQINVVVSDSPVESQLKELIINKHRIKLIEFDYSHLEGKTSIEKNLSFSNFLLESLCNSLVDYCFSFGSHILSGALLEKYKNRIINFHPALLPMFPGIKAIDQASAYGNVLLVGNTAHFIDSGVDTGPIIMQSVIPITNFKKTHNYDLILDLQIQMLNSLIDIINNGDLIYSDDTVYIRNANYSMFNIYPMYTKNVNDSCL